MRGAANNTAVLDDEMVMEIIEDLRGGWTTQTAIAKRLGINTAIVSRIARGETWKHLPRPVQQ